MNILHVNTRDCGGGAANIAWSLHKAATSQGCCSSMVVAEKRTDDCSVFVLPTSKIQKRIGQIFGSDFSFNQSAKIFDLDAYKQADLIHFHNLHGFYFNLRDFARICKEKKVIWTFHDLWPLTAGCAHTFSNKMIDGCLLCAGERLYPRFMWRRQSFHIKSRIENIGQSDFKIVVPCRWMQKKVNASYLSSKENKVIYNGVNTEFFSKDGRNKTTIRQRLGLPIDKKVIVFLAEGGKDNPWKGWNYFEKIRNLLSEYYFVSIGHNSDDVMAGNNFKQVGFSSQNDVADYLAAGDLFLFTSVAENFPLAILETMAAGLPVVSFDVGGVNEAIDGSGYVVPLGDWQEMAAKISQICNSKVLLSDFSSKAIANVREMFDNKIMIEQYFSLYKSLL